MIAASEVTIALVEVRRSRSLILQMTASRFNTSRHKREQSNDYSGDGRTQQVANL